MNILTNRMKDIAELHELEKQDELTLCDRSPGSRRLRAVRGAQMKLLKKRIEKYLLDGSFNFGEIRPLESLV